MNPLADFAQRIANLESKVGNILQVGIVTNVRESDNLVDVEVRGMPFDKVPYLTWRAGSDGKSYWTPEVNESGMLLCPDGQAGNAVFLPALNTTANPAPESDVDIFKLDFGSGNEIKVDGSETEIKRDTDLIKIDDSETVIERGSGSVKITIGTGLTATELEVSATQIKGTIAGVGKLLLNATTANLNGATFIAGITNMGNSAGLVIYTPVPIT